MAKIGRRIKKSTNKVTSSRGGWPGDETKDDAEPNCSSAGTAEASDLAQRLDRRALLQKLQAGGDDFVTRFKAAEHRIGVADGLSERNGHLMGDVSVAFGRREIDEGLAAHEADGKDWNHGRRRCAPGDARLDELLVAEDVRGARNLGLGEDALQAVIDLRREEADLRFDECLAGGVEDLYRQSLANHAWPAQWGCRCRPRGRRSRPPW